MDYSEEVTKARGALIDELIKLQNKETSPETAEESKVAVRGHLETLKQAHSDVFLDKDPDRKEGPQSVGQALAKLRDAGTQPELVTEISDVIGKIMARESAALKHGNRLVQAIFPTEQVGNIGVSANRGKEAEVKF